MQSASPWSRISKRSAKARIIMATGMTGLISRWWYGGHGLSVLKRNILGLIGVSPIRATIHGLIEGVSDHKRKF